MTSGMALRAFSTLSPEAKKATAAVGTATRRPWRDRAMKCMTSMPRILARSASLSTRWAKKTLTVRTKMVRAWPATASGTATAMASSRDCPPAMAMTVETVEARAASGAMAAPTFIQPRLSSSRAPPTIMPVFGSPRARPVRVQAMIGR